MRVSFSAWLAGAAVALTGVRAGANLEDGFAQDGVTTYCQGVNGPRGSPLEFNALEVHNAGRCPIDVKLDIKATTVGTQTPMDVQWAASVRSGNVPNNIFPRAVDGATKKPQDVIASLLRACKVGSNCAPESTIVPQVAGDGAETGPFDAQGRKALRPYRFLFPDPGHYYVVGVVTLPGDNTLNVSASEFVAFQRITVVDGVGPATVAPPSQKSEPEVGAEAKTTNINFQDSLTKTATTTPLMAAAESVTPSASQSAPASENRSGGGVDASFSGNNKSGSGSNAKSGGSNLTMLLVLGAVAVIMVAVLLYFIVVRRRNRTVQGKDKKKPLDPHAEAGIFRLSGGNGDFGSLSMGSSNKKQMVRSESQSVYSVASSLAPPRGHAASNASSNESGPFGRPTRQQSSGSQFPSYENPSLAASGKEFQTTRNPRKHSLASRASSSLSAYGGDGEEEQDGGFGDLHDSSASLPTIPNRKYSKQSSARGSVASSVSSYGEYDESRASSRLYSQSSRGPSEFSTFSDRASEYSTSRRSTELGALSERGTRHDEYEV